MKKFTKSLVGCAVACCMTTVGQAQVNVGGVVPNTPLEAGVRSATQAAIGGQDVGGVVREGVRGAVQNSIQGTIQPGTNQGTIQGTVQSGSQVVLPGQQPGTIQGNLQSGAIVSGQPLRGNTNVQSGVNGQVYTPQAISAEFQNQFRSDLQQAVMVNDSGRVVFKDDLSQEMQDFGFRANDQLIDQNGVIVSNTQAVSNLGTNGEYRVLRDNQIVTIRVREGMTESQKTHVNNSANHQQQKHLANNDHAQHQEHKVPQEIKDQLNRIEQMLKDLKADLKKHDDDDDN